MPSQYYIPPSLQSLTWAEGQSPFDSQNYKKYIYNDDGNLIWKSPSSFSMDQFAVDMRVRYVFYATSTYTNLSGQTFTQVKDASTNARHAIGFSNTLYISSDATAPLGGLLIQNTGNPYLRVPTTIFPASPSTKYFMCYVFHFASSTAGSPIFWSAPGGINYVRLYTSGSSGDGRFSNSGGSNINFNGFGGLNPSFKTKFCIVIFENTGTNTKVWINGVLVGSDSVAQNLAYGGSDYSLFNIGYSAPGLTFATSDMYFDEFFVIEGASCTDANRQKIEGLYAWKHRFETYLAAGHPYQNSAP